ncbi:MAG: efflux RND transporter periplasmic adaptor subunit [Deltaproteobacteria bacterium]|nr:efflux RND transporter periplasmic adaptor subunit [Deltaproteobacteria bacterium]MBW2676267.1 efflux RND transporter periplasmic adaptor subunit [Deltaproteobacteria bacterium]
MKGSMIKVVCVLCLFLFACDKIAEEKKAPPPPPKVTVIETQAEEIPLYQEFVGQVYGFKDIAIRARVEGFLEGIHFKEGSTIKKGKPLYTLESQPFEAEVAAKMSKVAEAKTALAYTESDLSRIRPLAEENAVSKSDLDAAVARYEASIASVEAAEANLRAANIQLSYTKIYSPINGIIGKTQAKVGDFVGKDPNPVILNTVSNIDTVLVEFFITETQYLEWNRFMKEREKTETDARKKAGLDLILADGSMYEHKGKVGFIDRQVDPTTGALLIQASFPNPDRLLRPGLFAKVKAKVDVVEDGIMIPQRCVTEIQGLYSVFVVGDGNKIDRREITVGPTIDSSWLIIKGLKPGEKVVYEGLQSARDGMVVNPKAHKIDQQ